MTRYHGKARNRAEQPQRSKAYVGEAHNHLGERRMGQAQYLAAALGLVAMLYLAVR